MPKKEKPEYSINTFLCHANVETKIAKNGMPFRLVILTAPPNETHLVLEVIKYKKRKYGPDHPTMRIFDFDNITNILTETPQQTQILEALKEKDKKNHRAIWELQVQMDKKEYWQIISTPKLIEPEKPND